MGLVFWRNVFKLIVLLPFVAQALRAEWYLMVRHWRLMVVIGFFNAIGQALVSVGLHTMTAVAGAVINATQPVLIVILGWLMISETLNRRQARAAGDRAPRRARDRCLDGDINQLLGLRIVIGDIWIELAMISWSVYQVPIKRVPAEMSHFVLLFIRTFTGMVGHRTLLYRRNPAHRLAGGDQPRHPPHDRLRHHLRADPCGREPQSRYHLSLPEPVGRVLLPDAGFRLGSWPSFFSAKCLRSFTSWPWGWCFLASISAVAGAKGAQC